MSVSPQSLNSFEGRSYALQVRFQPLSAPSPHGYGFFLSVRKTRRLRGCPISFSLFVSSLCGVIYPLFPFSALHHRARAPTLGKPLNLLAPLPMGILACDLTCIFLEELWTSMVQLFLPSFVRPTVFVFPPPKFCFPSFEDLSVRRRALFSRGYQFFDLAHERPSWRETKCV